MSSHVQNNQQSLFFYEMGQLLSSLDQLGEVDSYVGLDISGF